MVAAEFADVVMQIIDGLMQYNLSATVNYPTPGSFGILKKDSSGFFNLLLGQSIALHTGPLDGAIPSEDFVKQ